MWSIACYPSYTPEGGVPRARRIFRRYLPAEILTYLIINFLWAGLSLWLISTLSGREAIPPRPTPLQALTLAPLAPLHKSTPGIARRRSGPGAHRSSYPHLPAPPFWQM